MDSRRLARLKHLSLCPFAKSLLYFDGELLKVSNSSAASRSHAAISLFVGISSPVIRRVLGLPSPARFTAHGFDEGGAFKKQVHPVIFRILGFCIQHFCRNSSLSKPLGYFFVAWHITPSLRALNTRRKSFPLLSGVARLLLYFRQDR
jgi:hypothetical protein